MFASEKTEMVGLKQCHTCGAELLKREKFCRWCGVGQCLRTASSTPVTGRTNRPEFRVGLLPGGKNRDGSVSGAQVNVAAQSVSKEISLFCASHWMLHLVGILVALPLWLMIALLSPLAAYATAKAPARPGGQSC